MRIFFAAFLVLAACAPALGHQDVASATSGVSEACNVVASMPCEGGDCDAAEVFSARSLDSRRGRVSYYADSLAGHRTASGERYDPSELTLASRDLPFGAIVRIRRRGSGEIVVARVNDRGPSRRGGRILDLSKAAARCLDMIRAGVVEVDADVVSWGPRGRPR